MPNYAVFTGSIDTDQIHCDLVRARDKKSALKRISDIRGTTGHLVVEGDNPCALTTRELRGIATRLARLTKKAADEVIKELKDSYGIEDEEESE